MWSANFEDGSTISSKNTFWTQLDKNKRITGLSLTHPQCPNLQLTLSKLDSYFFVKEAVTFLSSGETQIVAEIIGGMKYGVVTELRLESSRLVGSQVIPGSVKSRLYPVSEYKYSQDILIKG